MKKKKYYSKVCRRCGLMFKADSRYSRICLDCNKSSAVKYWRELELKKKEKEKKKKNKEKKKPKLKKNKKK